MQPSVQVTADQPIKSRELTDVRAQDQDGLSLTAHQWEQAHGQRRACCGRRDEPLEPGGYAYVKLRGRLGYAVSVCPTCPTRVDGAGQ